MYLDWDDLKENSSDKCSSWGYWGTDNLYWFVADWNPSQSSWNQSALSASLFNKSGFILKDQNYNRLPKDCRSNIVKFPKPWICRVFFNRLHSFKLERLLLNLSNFIFKRDKSQISFLWLSSRSTFPVLQHEFPILLH